MDHRLSRLAAILSTWTSIVASRRPVSGGAPEVTVVKVAEPAPAATGGGLDWADAGIGAGGMLGLVLVAVASGLAVVHRRKGPRQGRPAVTT
jgi:hypothetical protein